MTLCGVKSLLKDVLSHRQVIGDTVKKLHSLIVSSDFSDEMSSAKNRYENLLAMAQVNLVYNN